MAVLKFDGDITATSHNRGSFVTSAMIRGFIASTMTV